MIGKNWHVGMEVVFVGWPEDSNPPSHGIDINIKEGLIYVIQQTTFIADQNAVYLDIGLVAWCLADGFRPVQKRATDISIFTAMLTGKKAEVDA